MLTFSSRIVALKRERERDRERERENLSKAIPALVCLLVPRM